MEPLQVANIVCFSFAVAAGLYQLWFHRQRPEQREALWGALISFVGAIYAACMSALYEIGASPEARPLLQLMVACVVVASHALPSYAIALHRRPIRHWRRIGTLSLGISLLLAFSPWVVTHELGELVLTLSPRPFPVWLNNPVAFVLVTANLGIASFGAWRLLLNGRVPRKSRLTFAGIVIWIVAGCADTLAALRFFQSYPTCLAEYGVLAFVLGMFGDSQNEYVALLKRQRESLRASRESLQALLEQSPELIGVHRDGRFVYVNPAGAKQLGFSDPVALVGRDVLELVDARDRDAASAHMQPLEGLDAPLEPARLRLVAQDGSTLVNEIISLPVRFDEQAGIMMLGRDLTSRAELERQMIQVDRLVAVGTLAAGVAHEINNPLMNVLVNVDLANDALGVAQQDASAGGLAALSQIRESLAEVQDGGHRIRDIVRDLAGLTRPRELEMVSTSVLEVLRHSLRVTENQIVHRAELELSLEEVAPVKAERGKLGQVFINLLVNAAQSVSTDGASERRVHVSTEMRGDQVVVAIEDSGRGIAPELLDRLFDPFFTTKEVGEGMGLGLAISHQIVSSHGGQLEVESELGVGSTFRVVLPATLEPVVALAAARAPVTLRGRVLIIDDQPAIVRSLRRLLSKEHDVVGVTRAAEGLELLASEHFDLILCDVMMPAMSGSDFYAAVAARFPPLVERIVFMTGGAFGAEVEAFMDSTDIQLLAKPLDIDALRELLRGAARSTQRRLPGHDGEGGARPH